MFRSKVLFQLSSSFWNLIFIFEIPHFQESALFTLFKGRLFSGFFAVSLFRAPSLVSRTRSVEFWGKQEPLLLNFIALQRYFKEIISIFVQSKSWPFSERFFVFSILSTFSRHKNQKYRILREAGGTSSKFYCTSKILRN